MVHIGKIIVISFKDGEEEALKRVLSVLTNEVQIEPMQADTCPVLQYPGLEIRQNRIGTTVRTYYKEKRQRGEMIALFAIIGCPITDTFLLRYTNKVSTVEQN